jgi:hypothetical protein
LNLVKFQEWGGATGKTQMAKYVSHDADLKHVRLSVARGTGKDRVVKEFDVEVDKLNKTCQARVKQIDVLQKHLDEMIANGADKPEAMAGQNGAEGPGGPAGNNRYANTRNRRNTGPRTGPEGARAEQAAATAGPEVAQPHPAAAPPSTSPESDPSASEPDPIGFAELPPVTPAAPGAGPAGPAGPGGVPAAGPGNVPAAGREGAPPAASAPAAASPIPGPAGAADAAGGDKWKSDLASFIANIKVTTDPAGKQVVDWGPMKEVREMNDILLAQQSPESPARSPEAETPAAVAERLGDLHWQIVVDRVDNAPGGLVIPSFHPVDVPQPVEMKITLDETDDLQKWAKLSPNSPVKVLAHLSMRAPYQIVAKVKLVDTK